MATIDYIFECIASDERAIRSINRVLKKQSKNIAILSITTLFASTTFLSLLRDEWKQEKEVKKLRERVDILEDQLMLLREGEQK